MDRLLDQVPADDPRRYFLATYRRSTMAIGAEVAAARFLDPPWVERWDVVFADLYLGPLADDLDGRPVPGPWGVAFSFARTQPQQPPLRHLLLGMNAHINFDLPQALLAVIDDGEFRDEALVARRLDDNERVDAILVSRVSAEDAVLAERGRTLTDRLLQPANRAATRRFVSESRRKVWANARVLSAARVRGPVAYAQTLAALERLCTGKIQELVRPGPVLLRLGFGGFGVTLPGAAIR